MSIFNIKKSKKGRPPVDSAPVTVRLQTDMIERLDDWRREQNDLPGRPEAIRRLVDSALTRNRALKYADEMTPEEDAAVTATALADPDNPPRRG